MLEKLSISIENVRVPVKRSKTLDADKLQLIAEDLIEKGQTTPIQVKWSCFLGQVCVVGQ